MPIHHSPPLVSAIIPTFNRRDFLLEALRSVLKQSYSKLEVILVDDGSTDGTAEIIRERFPEVRYYFQANRGPSAARNAGVALAEGEWLAFLDSDDLWQPRKIERQMAFLLAHPRYRACYTDEVWIRRGVRVNPRRVHRKYSGWIFPHTLPLCIISPSSILLHREIFTELGGFDEALPVCEDYDLWLRLCARHPVYFLEEPLIVKRGGHSDQLSNQEWGNDRFRVRALLKALADESGCHSREDKAAIRAQLDAKCRVLVQGFAKRGKTEEAAYYETIFQQVKQPIS